MSKETINLIRQASFMAQIGSTALIWVWLSFKVAITFFIILQIVITILQVVFNLKGKDE